MLATGLGPVAACREVGIGRKTGYRWRAECGGISPSRLAEEELSSRYFSLLERHRTATWRSQGCGVRDIARRIGRAPSTVSRECRRNLSPHDHDRYDGDLAQARARERAHRRRPTIRAKDDELRDVVQVKLKLDWIGAPSRSQRGYVSVTR